MSERQDDRTAEQKQTHTMLVVGTDKFMSDWGKATGGTSAAAWACRECELNACESYVRQRGDMSRVRIVADRPDYRPGAHLHIYVYNPNRHWCGGPA